MRTHATRTDAFESLSVRYNQQGRERLEKPEKPLPGRAKIYGAILYCISTKRYALVQGRQTGKWSFPKGHVNRYETPFECVSREVEEEIGLSALPIPGRGVPLGVGYYYTFDIQNEVPLVPNDVDEVMQTGWYTLEDMATMRLNIDASIFTRKTHTATFNM